jgi:hypothetical protein
VLETFAFALLRYLISNIDVTALDPSTRQAVEWVRAMMRLVGY